MDCLLGLRSGFAAIDSRNQAQERQKAPLRRGAGRQRRFEGGLLKRLASATWPLAGSRAPLLLPRVPFAGVLKLAALKQSSTPDANSTHGIRHGLQGPRRTEVVPAMSPARGQAAVSIRAEQKNLKKTNPGL